jgi:hypothetical protein
MKRFLSAAILAIAISGNALAAPAAPAVKTAPAAKPAAVAPAVPAATQAAAMPAVVAPSATELIEKIKAAYDKVNSYTVTFDMVQMLKPVNKRDELKEKKLTNIFELKYLKTDPANDVWMMRLTARKGHHQRTVVVYAPDKNGKSKFTVYKPAGKVVLSPEDPRTTDLPLVDLHAFIADIESAAGEKGAKAKVAYLAEPDLFALEISGENARTTTYVSSTTLLLVRQVLELKTRGGYGFKQEIRWRDFVSNAKLSPADITDAPAK